MVLLVNQLRALRGHLIRRKRILCDAIFFIDILVLLMHKMSVTAHQILPIIWY